jgi:hypothetical protein
MDTLAKEEFENAEQTFDALSELCEGHNRLMQDLLRDQPDHAATVNLVHLGAAMFVMLCETNAALRRMEEAEFGLVVSALNFLIESVQGPCPGNRKATILVACNPLTCTVYTRHEAILLPNSTLALTLALSLTRSLAHLTPMHTQRSCWFCTATASWRA